MGWPRRQRVRHGAHGRMAKGQEPSKDPRVALSLLGRGKNAMGLQEYLVVYGKARITEGRGGSPSAIGAHLSGARRGVSSRIVPQPARLHRAHHAGTLRGNRSMVAPAGLGEPSRQRQLSKDLCPKSLRRAEGGDITSAASLPGLIIHARSEGTPRRFASATSVLAAPPAARLTGRMSPSGCRAERDRGDPRALAAW
jgi:hypothetical protein